MERITLKRRTPFQQQREARNNAICTEYNKLAQQPGQSRMEVAEYLRRKHNLASISAIYRILKKGGVK